MIPLVVTIEALAAAETGGERAAPVSGEIFDFSHPGYADGVYQNARFGVGGEASPDLTVYADGRVETTRELEAGIYEITVLADSSPDYLGTATLGLWLTVRWLLEYGVDSGGGGEVRALDGGRGGVGFGGAAGGGRPGNFAGGSIEDLLCFGLDGGLRRRDFCRGGWRRGQSGGGEGVRGDGGGSSAGERDIFARFRLRTRTGLRLKIGR